MTRLTPSHRNKKNAYFNLSWNRKRIALHITWAILNLALLSYCLYNASGSDFEFIVIFATFIYCSSYWMLTSILFNKLKQL